MPTVELCRAPLPTYQLERAFLVLSVGDLLWALGIVSCLEGAQEFQKPVIWSKSLGLGAFVRLQLCERGFLQFKMCMKIGQCRFHRLMAQPQSNDRAIDARL